MNLSYAAMGALFPKYLKDIPEFLLPQEDKAATGRFIERILARLMNKAKPKGQRGPIGPTHPLRGEIEFNKMVVDTEASAKKQFPSDERLEDGRSRFFLKHGVLVDRLA